MLGQWDRLSRGQSQCPEMAFEAPGFTEKRSGEGPVVAAFPAPHWPLSLYYGGLPSVSRLVRAMCPFPMALGSAPIAAGEGSSVRRRRRGVVSITRLVCLDEPHPREQWPWRMRKKHLSTDDIRLSWFPVCLRESQGPSGRHLLHIPAQACSPVLLARLGFGDWRGGTQGHVVPLSPFSLKMIQIGTGEIL